jgi:thioredoxin reductase
MGCLERPIYYLSSSGSNFNLIPSRDFFRKHYDDIQLKFDYHVNFEIKEESEEEQNDFQIKIKLELEEQDLIDMSIIVKFSNEMSGKLSAKYKFELSSNFNYLISKKD